MLRVNKGIWAIGIPTALSVWMVVKQSVALFLIYILAHFLILKIVPTFRRRESIGMFIIITFSTIPINLFIMSLLWGMEDICGVFILTRFFRCFIYYMMLLSLEQVVMGVITRIIWRRQYKAVL